MDLIGKPWPEQRREIKRRLEEIGDWSCEAAKTLDELCYWEKESLDKIDSLAEALSVSLAMLDRVHADREKIAELTAENKLHTDAVARQNEKLIRQEQEILELSAEVKLLNFH